MNKHSRLDVGALHMQSTRRNESNINRFISIFFQRKKCIKDANEFHRLEPLKCG